jgi:hypothetical protein
VAGRVDHFEMAIAEVKDIAIPDQARRRRLAHGVLCRTVRGRRQLGEDLVSYVLPGQGILACRIGE